MTPERQTKKQKQDEARENARLLREEQRARKRRQRWIVQGGVVVGMLAVVAIAILVVFNVTRPPSPGPLNMLSDGILISGNGTATAAVATAAIQAGAKPVPTDPTAHKDTVNIVVYLDYQCPYCQQFETTNSDQIGKWVASGLATVEIHPIAILDNSSNGTKYSTRAANAAACVANFDPDKYLAVNNALFTGQPAENTSGLTDAALTTLVSDAGASGKDVASCIQNQTFVGWVSDATKRANKGPLPNSDTPSVKGTPTVLVNGKSYGGSITDPSAFSSFVGGLATANPSTGG
ncbi:MAG: thioredoxin domain-containing protein [Rhodoglobus sp.]